MYLYVEYTSHFFLQCHYYSKICPALLNESQSIDIKLLNQEDAIIVQILLRGSTKFIANQKFKLLSSSISYI